MNLWFAYVLTKVANRFITFYFLQWWLEFGQVTDSHPAIPPFHSSHKHLLGETKAERSLQVKTTPSFFLSFFPASPSLLHSQLLYFLLVPSSAGGWGMMGSQSVCEAVPFCCSIRFLFSSVGQSMDCSPSVKTCSSNGPSMDHKSFMKYPHAPV